MPTLKEQLLFDARPAVVADCVQLVEEEVSRKRGLSGLAIKGAYRLVKKINSGIIGEAVDRLLDDFVGQLESFYAEFVAAGSGGFSEHVSQRKGEVAAAMLGITDERIRRADSKIIQKAYTKLRPAGQKQVEAAVPGVGRIIQKYV